jgi:hypothetical protein
MWTYIDFTNINALSICFFHAYNSSSKLIAKALFEKLFLSSHFYYLQYLGIYETLDLQHYLGQLTFRVNDKNGRVFLNTIKIRHFLRGLKFADFAK